MSAKFRAIGFLRDRGEVPLLPAGEVPESVQDVQERFEGKQISGVYLNPGPLPTGWAALGLEFTDSSVLIVMAAPVLEPDRYVRLVYRWVAPQRIWTRSMARIYGSGLGRAEPINEWSRRLQGEVLRGVLQSHGPDANGGEQITLLFGGDRRLVLHAMASAEGLAMGRPVADLDAQLYPLPA